MKARRFALVFSIVSAIAASSCAMPTPLDPTLEGSVGLPHAGFLSHGRELPSEGAGFRVLSTAHHHWGLPRLVDLVADAADSVHRARPGLPPLYVGELSAKHGGALLPRHRSHRSGRDVDLLLFVTSVEGAPIAGDGFTKIGADGLGVDPTGRFVRFDADREWLLIKSLVTSDKAQIQFIFIARVLQALVVEHAIALGEPAEIIARAEALMKQPGDSLPHDDHIHVRIACDADEFAKGCDGGGAYWPWLPHPTHVEPTREHVAQVAAEVADWP